MLSFQLAVRSRRLLQAALLAFLWAIFFKRWKRRRKGATPQSLGAGQLPAASTFSASSVPPATELAAAVANEKVETLSGSSAVVSVEPINEAETERAAVGPQAAVQEGARFIDVRMPELVPSGTPGDASDLVLIEEATLREEPRSIGADARGQSSAALELSVEASLEGCERAALEMISRPNFTGVWLLVRDEGPNTYQHFKDFGTWGWARLQVLAAMRYGVGKLTQTIQQEGDERIEILVQGHHGTFRQRLIIGGAEQDTQDTVDGSPVQAVACWDHQTLIVTTSTHKGQPWTTTRRYLRGDELVLECISPVNKIPLTRIMQRLK